MAFTNRDKASEYHPMKFEDSFYYERTKRNHYWLGGIEGQKKLKDLRVGIAGLGGMGSNLAEIMVRLGVGHLKIADPDIIEISNINRQVIANKQTVGEKKASASVKELRNICQDFELVVYDDGITKENAEEFVSDLDIIIDEIDVFPLEAHVWLHRAANKHNLPLYSGFIVGLGTHIYKYQGTDYTFEDFLQQNKSQFENPSIDFLVDRFVTPTPSYMSSEQKIFDFVEEISENSVPIFGTSTFLSHSVLAIRAISDFLGLSQSLSGKETPVMPNFIRIDPLELKLEICNIENLSNLDNKKSNQISY